MLWLCIHLHRWPLEALNTQLQSAPAVVTAAVGNSRWIVCCNAAAERAHLNTGMHYTVALAMHSQLTMLERKPHMEQTALERLAAWAYQFSCMVVLGEIATQRSDVHDAHLWLEIGSSLKLFGGLRKLIGQLEDGLEKLHYSYQLGIAPTLEGAAVLARANVRIAITSLPALYTRIRPLPLLYLDMDTQVAHQLHTAGVRSIGLLLELPRASLAKRFGLKFASYLDRLTGVAADPRPAFRLPEHYTATLEFEFEVRRTEALLFPVRRMLYEMSGFLRARDVAIQHFQLQLLHRSMAPTVLMIGMVQAERDAERFFSLVREKLERVTLEHSTIGVHLLANELCEPNTQQPDLIDTFSQQQEELSHTLDRITARLGSEHVFSIKAIQDHRPERSWSKVDLHGKSEPLHFPERPLWLLPEPKPLEPSSLPNLLSGPERIESGWWDDFDAQRDYFVACTRQGERWWVYCDLRDGSWYLQGYWA